jgi:glycosyltransferase involved in cell wall biosynthesis
MRIAIATVQVPFIQGGAESHAQGLLQALQAHGHSAEIITLPFRFAPPAAVRRSMAQWQSEDLEQMNGYRPDRAICLRFPAFYLQHPHKIAWVLHQHRSVYDLWDSAFTDQTAHSSADCQALRQAIHQQDTAALQACQRVFANSQTVADQLSQFNQITATPLYHPPPNADAFYRAEPLPYIFCPSRLETLKRQELLIRAMAQVRSPVVALIAGTGGQQRQLQALIEALGLADRVRLLGHLSDAEHRGFYARALGVFFGPYQEDYGYVTLEAMLAAKPVITCVDSGGPTEFVIDGVTGAVVEPTPGAIAGVIDSWGADRAVAIELGQAGHERYQSLNLTWDAVVQALLI